MPKWHWPQEQGDRGQPGICPSLGKVCNGQGWGSRRVTPWGHVVSKGSNSDDPRSQSRACICRSNPYLVTF